MATLEEQLTQLYKEFQEHIAWDNIEHAQLRKENDSDTRALLGALNDLRITVERGINKVIMFAMGTTVTIVGGVVTQLIIAHLK